MVLPSNYALEAVLKVHMSPTLINVMRHRPLPLAVPDAVAFPSEEVVCALVRGL